MKIRRRLFSVMAALNLLVAGISAQTGGDFTITKTVIAGGGGRVSGENYTLGVTLGQAVAGTGSAGGNFNILPGFWSPDDKNRTPYDFDGDRKSDIGIFRPADGSWWYSRSSDNQFRVFRFGVSSDKLVPSDYTGDGKADIAVFRPASGEWFIQRSEDNSYYSIPFGQPGDLAAPGDYDGDGRFDAAIFRPSTANWFVQRSTAGILIATFGANGDRPIPNSFVP